MIVTYLLPLALGISLSACCGFRIFIPMLVAAIASKFGWLPLSSGFEWLGTYTAIIAFGVAAILETLGYYIPLVDNFLDALATPAAVIAGTLLSASVFIEFDPMLKWTVALIAGGGTAGVIQAGTGFLRLGSTKLTAGTGNHVLATAENIFSLSGTVMALILPLLMCAIVVFGVFVVLYLMLRKVGRLKTS